MIYAEGGRVTTVSLPIGRTSFLLCGDLFNDAGLNQVKQEQPNWLVVPMARGFDSELFTAEQWYKQDRFYYIERSQSAGSHLLLVNQLATYSEDYTYFGGAMAVTKDGRILTDYPLEQEGILYLDID